MPTTREEKKEKEPGKNKEYLQGCLQAIYQTGGSVGRQRKGGANQPPLVGSAKQIWPGAEEVANIRSIRMKEKREKGKRKNTHTCTHITQTCEINKVFT